MARANFHDLRVRRQGTPINNDVDIYDAYDAFIAGESTNLINDDASLNQNSKIKAGHGETFFNYVQFIKDVTNKQICEGLVIKLDAPKVDFEGKKCVLTKSTVTKKSNSCGFDIGVKINGVEITHPLYSNISGDFDTILLRNTDTPYNEDQVLHSKDNLTMLQERVIRDWSREDKKNYKPVGNAFRGFYNVASNSALAALIEYGCMNGNYPSNTLIKNEDKGFLFVHEDICNDASKYAHRMIDQAHKPFTNPEDIHCVVKAISSFLPTMESKSIKDRMEGNTDDKIAGRIHLTIKNEYYVHKIEY